ncbi:MAG: sugar ABC transporter ATP-binding protein [Streptosporangiaceae bacterium]
MTESAASSAARDGQLALELRGVTKRYAGIEVLADASLAVHPGEIHALVGENGAGKSTLLRIAAGLVRPDAGGVWVAGRRLRAGHPRVALDAGVALVSQELASVPARSVLENVYLGTGRAPYGRMRRASVLADFAALCRRTGIALPPDAPARSLAQAERQQLEVLRALARDPRVLILDEPTAALDGERTERLIGLLRRLASDGLAVVFVSHRLEEALSLAKDVTVLRDGRVAASGSAAGLDESTLVRHMVGREVRLLYPDLPDVPADAPRAFTASDLRAGSAVKGISLNVRRGEIVGLAGLVGSGRSEFARAALGADHVDGGTISVGGGQPFRPTSVRRTLAAGVGLMPEDRKSQGLVLQRSVSDNLALGSLRAFCRYGVVSRRRTRAAATAWVRDADIRPPDPTLMVGALSGGNQQKVLLAKWLATEPRLLVADEPTRGVDIGAKTQIHEMIAGTARQGIGILLISSELEEVLGLSHRVIVFRHGRAVGEYPSGQASREAVVAAAFGVDRGAEGLSGGVVSGEPHGTVGDGETP